jgi:hypothetical protein
MQRKNLASSRKKSSEDVGNPPPFERTIRTKLPSSGKSPKMPV